MGSEMCIRDSAKAETTYRLYEDYLYVIEDIVEMRAELGVIVI